MKTKNVSIAVILIAAPAACVFFSLFAGRYPLAPGEIASAIIKLLSGGGDGNFTTADNIVAHIRLPRALLGALVGASLAVSGAALQGLFRNPLVSSGMLGVSSGAGFGAALAIVFFKSTAMIYVLSFSFGLLAVFLSYMIGRIYNTSPTIMLILGGVVISSIFSALLSLLKYLANPYDELPSIVFWLMGSLAQASMSDLTLAFLPAGAGAGGLLLMRWRLNVLSMGEKEARSMGLNVGLYRLMTVVCATLATAGAVSVSGIIGWVGLVVPHIGRLIAGNDNRKLVPASMSLGACFMIIVDNLSRTLTGSEIPLGILTALIGGPFFIYLLRLKREDNWL